MIVLMGARAWFIGHTRGLIADHNYETMHLVRPQHVYVDILTYQDMRTTAYKRNY